METKEAIKVMTPEKMAVAQKSQDGSAKISDEIVEVLAALVQLCILRAGYIPYIDHPTNHPSYHTNGIEINLVNWTNYFQHLREIFERKGWQLLPRSRYNSQVCTVVVKQTIEERREWIRKMWEKSGHKLAPWDLGHHLDETHCINEGCNLKIIFRHQIPTEYREGTEYPIGEGVWARDFAKCPVTPLSED